MLPEPAHRVQSIHAQTKIASGMKNEASLYVWKPAHTPGGTGGFGANPSPASGAPRNPYSSSSNPGLLGGSGGARSGLSPATVNALGNSESTLLRSLRGLGGAGGGAIELAALNDVTIGVMGSISVDGGNGMEDWDGGGGGGSGGSVIVSAGGVLRHAGVIYARGGDGGRTFKPLSRNAGGGGAGGRVALYGQSVEVLDGPVGGGGESVNVGGGRCVEGESRYWRPRQESSEPCRGISDQRRRGVEDSADI